MQKTKKSYSSSLLCWTATAKNYQKKNSLKLYYNTPKFASLFYGRRKMTLILLKTEMWNRATARSRSLAELKLESSEAEMKGVHQHCMQTVNALYSWSRYIVYYATLTSGR